MNLSPRVSVCRSWRQHGEQGSCQHLARKGLQSQVGSRGDKVLSLAGQSLWQPMPRKISVAWNALWCVKLVCLISGLEPASVTPLKWWTPPFWVFSINVLAPLLASVELPPEPIYGWSCSADVAGLTTCAGILSVSPCQTCLLWPHRQICLLATCVYSDLSNFPLQPKCHGWLKTILVDISDSILFYILYVILILPMPFYWSFSPQTYARGSLLWLLCDFVHGLWTSPPSGEVHIKDSN